MAKMKHQSKASSTPVFRFMNHGGKRKGAGRKAKLHADGSRVEPSHQKRLHFTKSLLPHQRSCRGRRWRLRRIKLRDGDGNAAGPLREGPLSSWLAIGAAGSARNDGENR